MDPFIEAPTRSFQQSSTTSSHAQSAPHPNHQPSNDDPLESLLHLEDTLYTAAYTLGSQDGAHAGRIEGRIFGLEKGFEKFTSLGELHGRSVVWGSRIPQFSKIVPKGDRNKEVARGLDGKVASEEVQEKEKETQEDTSSLPPLPYNTRLHSHITLLYHLTDPTTFSTLNTEDAVADYDDRFRRAGAKAKVIERLIGETAETKGGSGGPAGERDVEEGVGAELKGRSGDAAEEGPRGKGSGSKAPRRVGRSAKITGDGAERKGDDNMEDFLGVGVRRTS
ncbi:hypothetical protein GQ43DRAFT_437702 [Delitschia confertaspora ATCC 74209]|uniref:Essential protein Yae1 N-terminal domain-containing protein n=1 Tax=Delitschia confertaspora ATCC 74209 TaxID=1513339 RepID=A0A9P4JSX1_9PLEO|nr:hypothetical protein GQ43DRAFT_437702 [Delitschia confertaspora ATCC 74209]